jgi:cytochrome c peroxidase
MRFYPFAAILFLLVFSAMSFNPVDKGVKSEDTFINKVYRFKNKLEN